MITLSCLVLTSYSQKVKKTYVNYIQEYYPELLFQDDIKTYQVKINYNDKNINNDSTYLKNSFSKINFKQLEKTTINPDIIVQFDINAPVFKEKTVDQNGAPKKRFLNKIYVSIRDKKDNYYLKGYVSDLSGVNATFTIDESDNSRFPFLESMKNNGIQCCNAINSIFNYKTDKGSLPFYYLKGDTQLESLADRIKNNLKKDTLIIKPSVISDSLNKIKDMYSQMLNGTVETVENKIKRETLIYNIAALNLLLGNHKEFNSSIPLLKDSEEKDFMGWTQSDFMVELYNNKNRYDKIISQKQKGKYDPYYYPIYNKPYFASNVKKLTMTGYLLTLTDTIKCELYFPIPDFKKAKIEYTLDKGLTKKTYTSNKLQAVLCNKLIYVPLNGNFILKPNQITEATYNLITLLFKSDSIMICTNNQMNQVYVINLNNNKKFTAEFPKEQKIPKKEEFIQEISNVLPKSDKLNSYFSNQELNLKNDLLMYLEIIQLAENKNSIDDILNKSVDELTKHFDFTLDGFF